MGSELSSYWEMETEVSKRRKILVTARGQLPLETSTETGNSTYSNYLLKSKFAWAAMCHDPAGLPLKRPPR